MGTAPGLYVPAAVIRLSGIRFNTKTSATTATGGNIVSSHISGVIGLGGNCSDLTGDG